MPDPVITDYIKKQRKKGVTKAKIIAALKKSGWSEEKIKDGFGDSSNSSSKTSKSTELKTIGELINDSWTVLSNIWKRMLGLYTMVIVAGVAPMIGLGIFVGVTSRGEPNPFVLIPFGIVGVLVMVVASILFQLMIVHAIKDRDKNVSYGQMYEHSVKQIWPYLLTSFAVGILVILGLVVFIIPGIILAVWFGFSMYEVIYHNKRPADAMLASRTYVIGRWWSIAFRLIAFGLLVGIISVVVGILTEIMGAISPVFELILVLASFVINIVTAPLMIIYAVLVYENARDSYTGKVPEASPDQRLWANVIGVGGLLFVPVAMVLTFILVIWLARSDYSSGASLYNQTQQSQVVYDARQIQNALDLYHVDHLGAYPDEIIELVPEYIDTIPGRFSYEPLEGGSEYKLCVIEVRSDKAVVGDCYYSEGSFR